MALWRGTANFGSLNFGGHSAGSEVQINYERLLEAEAACRAFSVVIAR